MSTMNHARRFIVYQVQLGRDELDHLIALAGEDMPSPQVQFETERHERSFQASDLDSLNRRVRKLCGPRCSTRWTDLLWLARSDDRSAVVRFRDNRLTVEFNASDESWVSERERDVSYFLHRETGAREGPLRLAVLRWLFPLALTMICIFLWGELGLWSVMPEATRNRATNMGMSMLFAATALGAYATYRRLRTVSIRQSRTEVDVEHPWPPQQPLLRLMVPDWASAIVASLIASVATLAAVLALVATGLQGGT
ncbi:hypothetical protein ACFT38_00530 [Streptomyces sp. NPDC056975]|uniref:hypothetical protein n=1 Tax=Streptomyces sp. NPDC056975 TaxID=3345985 RepID=UPI00363F1E42